MTPDTTTTNGRGGRVLAHEVRVGDRLVWGRRPVTITEARPIGRTLVELASNLGDRSQFDRSAAFTRLPANARVTARR